MAEGGLEAGAAVSDTPGGPEPLLECGVWDVACEVGEAFGAGGCCALPDMLGAVL